MKYTSETPAGIGIIGCGNISQRYIEGMARFPEIKLLGCADLITELAEKAAAGAGVKAYSSIEELLADPAIDIVVNITPPVAHAPVTIAALNAGKNVYVEKPIAVTLSASEGMIEEAQSSGKLLGSAPDTFLGSAGQTARAAIDSGVIGEPIGAVAFVTHSKAETWHPNPTFLFQPGGGPALDMGPYYITTLVNSLGPVASVSGFSRVGAPLRTVTAPDRQVDSIEVNTPTHAGATLKFDSGAIATLMLSFDAWDTHLPFIEIYGHRGTLSVPDPNQFDGVVSVRLHNDEEWRTLNPVVPVSGEPDTDVQMLRGAGVADLVGALNGLPHRASADLAHHVLEVLEAIETSSQTETVIHINSRVGRPAPCPTSEEV
ncbi:Gfo/Idh/MocA family oxidoreductase [Saxibacter everestensis]|uniref:Gfo/Idh/MocA family oxidoreductase n=1 Tax=Saxibacter everestensis TaxID=2909229 RepID=A0ABY8QWS6_9MICO|nr:Gfo/Idh/MocA family oxidoreductase [Brevibacteriaceae bacterium ZFBP1038]